MKTKDLIVKKYLKNNGTFCPFCGSSDLNIGDPDINDGQMNQPVYCNHCDNEWTDHYVLTNMSYEGVVTTFLEPK